MAYRDEKETRLAHLRRLESQLDALKAEEARIRALPGSEGTAFERALGGPKVFVREIRVDHPIDETTLLEHANEAFDVEGRIVRESGALVWRAEPEPRPRRVEVRVTADGGGSLVRVKDQGSWRLYAGLVGFTGVLPQLFRADGMFGGAMGAVVLLAFAMLVLSLRARVLKNTRRRMHQAETFVRGVEARSRQSTARVRVDAPEVLEADAIQEAEPAVAKVAMR